MAVPLGRHALLLLPMIVLPKILCRFGVSWSWYAMAMFNLMFGCWFSLGGCCLVIDVRPSMEVMFPHSYKYGVKTDSRIRL